MKPLHLEYRPQNFKEFIGGEAIKESIMSGLDRTQTYLFYGQRGCGKTTLARLIADLLKIDKVDIYELDAADKTSVDDARRLKATVYYSPMAGDKKIYIIDEVHRLSGNAMDSLLKTLEEPPLHCIFVLCTTELGKVSRTIKSRSKIYEVKPLTLVNSGKLIDWVCKEEEIKLSEDVRKFLIDLCEGIPRELIISLDMVRDIKDSEKAVDLIFSAIHKKEVIDLCRALLAVEKWYKIAEILKGIQEEPENVRYAVLGWMNSVLLKGNNKQAAFVMTIFRESFMYSKKAGLTIACWEAVN